MNIRLKDMLLLSAAGLLLLLTACSTHQNTAKSRWWHAFNTRYNVYFNGAQAYVDGSLEKENAHRDNYTDLLPLYYVGNKNSVALGKAGFDKAIEKSRKAISLHSIKRRPVWDKQRRKTDRDREWLARKEYNPFLWKAWLLMGRSQFHQGLFDEAVATFSHMSHLYATQPSIYQRAQAWLAKSHVEQGTLYEAEDIIRNMGRDSIHWLAQKEWNYTLTDYYLHTADYAKAAIYLRRVIAREQRRKQKAREWYLMGQLLTRLGRRSEAYEAYRKVVSMNPPYELEFNARIAMTEVIAGGQQRQMIARLGHMAASDKNKDYLDQVYYAIGNIYLSQHDTLMAIRAYEDGNAKAVHSGWTKGVLLQTLGNLYWSRHDFADARRCYTEAIGLLDKSREGYGLMTERSEVLDELVPHMETIALQDSLLCLATLPESERLKAADRAMEAYRKKEKKMREAMPNPAAAAPQRTEVARQNLPPYRRNGMTPLQPAPTTGASTWYFYNPMAVERGKETFRTLWGNRPNADDWQRTNKTVVGDRPTMNRADQPMAEAPQAVETLPTEQSTVSVATTDPLTRDYYLAQIPLTADRQAESRRLLAHALFRAGVIFKDKLNELALSEALLTRIERDFPRFEQMDEVYYHLFLLYSRADKPVVAEGYVAKLKRQFEASKWTSVLTDPYFKENAVFGEQIEDSLYGAAYEAFKVGNYSVVKAHRALSDRRFPTGANRDKFLFIGGLSRLNEGDVRGCLADMRLLIEKYPESKLSEPAGMLINGVKAGRTLHGGNFSMDNLWQRRTAVLSDSDSIVSRPLSEDMNGEFLYVMVYHPDSVRENQLLFELARHNFTNYLIRNFELTIEHVAGAHRMVVSGFRNYREALLYSRQLRERQAVTRLMADVRSLIISKVNLDRLGQGVSYADYEQFYRKHFESVQLPDTNLLNEPAEIVYKKEPVAEPSQQVSPVAPPPPAKPKQLDLEDEYYDLEGF